MCILKGWNRAATLIFIIIFPPPTNQWVEFPENGKSPVSQVSSSQGDNLRILVWSEQQRWIQSRFIFSSTTKSWETAHHSKTWNGCFCLINDSVDTSSGLSNNQVLFFCLFFSPPKSKVFFTYQLALSDRRSFCSQDQLRPGGGGILVPAIFVIITRKTWSFSNISRWQFVTFRGLSWDLNRVIKQWPQAYYFLNLQSNKDVCFWKHFTSGDTATVITCAPAVIRWLMVC